MKRKEDGEQTKEGVCWIREEEKQTGREKEQENE